MNKKPKLIKIAEGLWRCGDVVICDRWFEHKAEGRWCVKYFVTSLCFVEPAKKYFTNISKAKAFVRGMA